MCNFFFYHEGYLSVDEASAGTSLLDCGVRRTCKLDVCRKIRRRTM